MRNSVFFLLLQKLCRRDIINTIFSGILDRAPSTEEFSELRQRLSSKDGLNQLLAAISSSDEAWALAIRQRSDELATRLFSGMLGRVPSEDERHVLASEIHQSGSFDGPLRSVIQSDEAWNQSIKGRADELVARLYVGLLGRPPSEAERLGHAQEITATGSFDSLLRVVIQSDEAWDQSIKGRADELVTRLYTGMLGRTPSEAERLDHAQEIAASGSFDSLLRVVIQSDEAWDQSIKGRADELVTRLYTGMLGRTPSEAERLDHAQEIAASGSFDSLLRNVIQSDEAWDQSIKGRADELVTRLYTGMLGRTPSETESSGHVHEISATGNFHSLLRAVIQSDEAWDQSIKGRADELVTRLYTGILGRTPTEAERAGHAQEIAASGSFDSLLRVVIQSDEAWDQSIKGRADELVTRLYTGILGRTPSEAERLGHAQEITTTGSFDSLLRDVIQSEELLDKTVKQHADRFVEDIYVSALKRTPNTDERTFHAREIAVSGKLSGFVSAIAASDELWQLNLQSHAPELAESLYRGLTNDVLVEEHHRIYSQQLGHNGGIEEVLKSIRSSDAAWSMSIKTHLPKLIEEIFKSVLQQTPAPEDIASFVDVEDGSEGIAILAAALAEARLRQQVLSLEVRQQWIHSAYQMILGRLADESGLAHFTQVCNTYDDLKQLFEQLINSEEYRLRQFYAVRTSIIDALRPIYRSTPDIVARIERDLESVNDVPALGNALVSAIDPQGLIEYNYHCQRKRPLYVDKAVPRLESQRPLALVFVLNEAWLPFCIAIADALRETDGLESVFVWWEWSPAIAQAYSLSPNIYDVIGYEQLQNLPADSQFKPCMLVLHSYGFAEQNLFILQRFEGARLLVYADCYKNEIDDKLNEFRSIEGGVYFGYQPEFRSVKPYKIIPYAVVNDAIDRVASLYEYRVQDNSTPVEKSPYAMVYIRYWGIGPYVLDVETVTDIMVATIVKGVDLSLELVLKNDVRINTESFVLLTKKLQDKGYQVSLLDAALASQSVDAACADLPVEFLLSQGILCDATCHVVFDSSLSCLIASSRHITQDVSLIVGADLGLIPDQIPYTPEDVASLVEGQLQQERGVAPRSYAAAITTIRLYSKQYADAILNTIEGVELNATDHIAYYSLRLNRSGDVRIN